MNRMDIGDGVDVYKKINATSSRPSLFLKLLFKLFSPSDL